VREAVEDLRPEDDFVLFDLGEESLLEPISSGDPGFRVTQYDPRLLASRHRLGTHQYLVAKQAMEADVVINLPKLKTHKKAGITCALKNLIGINGNKEFLPHHRLGGSDTGGDCYEGGGRFRLLLEKAMDRYNMAGSRAGARFWHELSGVTAWLAKNVDGSDEIEGAWSGNDTVWRTCLDLNRILLYGRVDGTMADTPQRREIHVVDAVTAGQGDGPLSPDPLPLGLVLAGGNGAAVDWIGAQLLGFDPHRIPIAREAFGRFRWPLTTGPEGAVEVLGEGKSGGPEPGFFFDGEIKHPAGWEEAGHTLQVGISGES
jgi:hypothetical protein